MEPFKIPVGPDYVVLNIEASLIKGVGKDVMFCLRSCDLPVTDMDTRHWCVYGICRHPGIVPHCAHQYTSVTIATSQ